MRASCVELEAAATETVFADPLAADQLAGRAARPPSISKEGGRDACISFEEGAEAVQRREGTGAEVVITLCRGIGVQGCRMYRAVQ